MIRDDHLWIRMCLPFCLLYKLGLLAPNLYQYFATMYLCWNRIWCDQMYETPLTRAAMTRDVGRRDPVDIGVVLKMMGKM